MSNKSITPEMTSNTAREYTAKSGNVLILKTTNSATINWTIPKNMSNGFILIRLS